MLNSFHIKKMKVFVFLFNSWYISGCSPDIIRSHSVVKLPPCQLTPEAFCFNSSHLHTFYKWLKRGNVNDNIIPCLWPNAKTFTPYSIRPVKIFFTLLISLNNIVHYCYRRGNIFFSVTPVHSRVNMVHFKGAHLNPCETYTMKQTWTWDCLPEHQVHITQISFFL